MSLSRKWPIVALSGALPLAAGAAELRALQQSELQVTEGVLAPAPSRGITVNTPKMRAVSLSPSGDVAELRFRYFGATSSIARLDDGEARQQLGLKLRAADACNVVYVMWRLEPRSELAVQVKYNPDQHTSRECGARGYRKLPGATPLPRLEIGSEHSLRAELHGDQLEVRVDGKVAWHGGLGPQPIPSSGPAGLRTDNVHMDFQLAIDDRATVTR